MTEEKRLVWDLPLRVFHWLFALSIVASWATAKAGFEYMQYHFYLGYWMIGLVLFRVIWGCIGPRHARFANFLRGPATLLKYFRSLGGRGAAVNTAGHNPAGGLMAIAMVAMVALQAGTGLFATDDIAWSGPYTPAVSASLAGKLTSLHHANFNWLLGAVALHLLAIGFYWL